MPQRNEPDTRLTVIEVNAIRGQYGPWTELEVWYWFHGDARPKRFRIGVNGRPGVQVGDLVKRDMKDSAVLWWWDHKERPRPGALQVISEAEELPPLV